MNTIFEKFNHCLQEHPDQLLYVFLDKQGKIKESYTYRSFDEKTKVLAGYLKERKNLEKGDRILLAYPPGLEMICAFFACARIGLIPVPVYPPANQGFHSSLQKMNFIAEDCGAVAVLTDRTYYWSMQINLTRKKLAKLNFKSDTVSKLDWIVSSDARFKGASSFVDETSEVLFIQYTSGSTNQPKGVMVTHENIIYNGEIVVDHKPIGVSWLPQYHDMGLIGYYLFFAMKGGTTYGFSPLDFIQRPALWFETITKYKGTASSAPNFAYEYCLRPGKIPAEAFASFDLSSLKFLMTAAEPIRTKTYEAFISKFSPLGLNPNNYFAAYGLAEFSLAVSNYGRNIVQVDAAALSQNKVRLADEKQPSTTLHSIMSCGHILGDTKVKIVSVNSEPVEAKEMEVGEVWLTGSSKCMGYWNQPELSRGQFKAKLPNSEDEWLRTGDLGFILNEELYICGRTKDMIIVRGLNYYPHDIELLVEQDKNIRKGCSVAFAIEENGREKVVVIAELKSGKSQASTDEINQRIQQYLGILVDHFTFIPARSISKTSSGKIMRSQMKQRFLSNDLKVVSAFSVDEVERKTGQSAEENQDDSGFVGGPFEQLFKKYNLTGMESESLADLGFDSLRLAEFAHDLKETIQGEGYTELAQEIDLRLLQKIAMSELFELVQGLNQSVPQAKFRFKAAFHRIHKEFSLIEQEMMRSDAQFDLAKELNWKPTASLAVLGKGVFLTGATGFFGPFLLQSILSQTEDDVWILVRASTEEDGLTKLRKAFETIHPSEWEWDQFTKRTHIVLGDLSQLHFGLTLEEWMKLDESIHTIYHNGALVNYLLDYESMRGINVDGTTEVLRLAMGKVPKCLNHISTTFIFGWSVKDTLFETDRNEEMERLDFGYSQSKWVSEQLVFNAMKHGLKARVFRPALISPSIQGDGYNFDISIRLLAFMLNHGIGTLAQNQVSFTPANLGAQNIVAISQLKESAGLTFHVTRDAFASMKDITDILGQLTGKSFQEFSLKDFVPEVVGRCQKEDLLFPLLNFLVKSVENIGSMEFKLYSNANYRTFRMASKHGISDPSLEEVVRGILTFMLKHHIVSID